VREQLHVRNLQVTPAPCNEADENRVEGSARLTSRETERSFTRAVEHEQTLPAGAEQWPA
jgi:hypothetical protein